MLQFAMEVAVPAPFLSRNCKSLVTHLLIDVKDAFKVVVKV